MSAYFNCYGKRAVRIMSLKHLKFAKRNPEIMGVRKIAPEENCPPSPRSGSGFGLGLALELGLRGNFPKT